MGPAIAGADEFHARIAPSSLTEDQRRMHRRALAGMDRRASGMVRPRQRERPRPRPAELLPRADEGRPAGARLRPRLVLRRLARHAAARRRQSGPAAGDDRRAGTDRRAKRRRALRHGDAGPARRVRAHLGHPGQCCSPARHRQRLRARSSSRSTRRDSSSAAAAAAARSRSDLAYAWRRRRWASARRCHPRPDRWPCPPGVMARLRAAPRGSRASGSAWFRSSAGRPA